ncbi:MAG: 16S rRNA (cytosine(1402)-N(4))-methyltransferase, partial [Propionibacteriaceae bacterium]|nr:16S rRNA (cytosine(1402)-N(4))-methyltransferase [Propionibacteriaceae bacterium]
NAMPAAVRFGSGGHPAKRVYQSLRIAVNGELEALANVLPLALDRLGLGGRIAVLSYHSLEDRLVKQAFQKASQDQAPRGLPIVPDGLLAQFSLVSRGALRPTDDEITRNPRAASARLRVIKRIKEA